jgi:ketosteroid isomerase-like protein
MTPEETADRVAIRELIDAYARAADRRDADGQMALFTPDTHFVVYMDARSSEPSMELHSRGKLASVFDDLNRYVATTHFNGQSTVTISGAAATGESYCLAHHVSVEGDERTIMVAAIRYRDTFTKSDGTWLFSERRLYVDWTDTRPIASQR